MSLFDTPIEDLSDGEVGAMLRRLPKGCLITHTCYGEWNGAIHDGEVWRNTIHLRDCPEDAIEDILEAHKRLNSTND